MRLSRNLQTGLVVGAFLLLGGVAAAWACTPQAQIDVDPKSGPAGENVIVDGTAFTDTEVELHWDSATGPVLAVTEGPNFKVEVVVPVDAAPGNYVIMAVHTSVDPMHAEVPAAFARTPFLVTEPAPETAAPSEPKGSGGTSNEPKGSGAGNEGKGSSSPSGDTGAASAPSNQEGAVAFNQTDPDDRAVSLGDTSIPSNVVDLGRDGRVFRGSLPAAGGVSEATVFSDIWAGYSERKGASLLQGLSDPIAAAPGPGSELALGLGLLGLGVFALLGAFIVAGARRRRSEAPVPGENR